MKPPSLADIDIALLRDAGFRIEGPSEEGGIYWWTLYREGWSGIECGPDFATEAEAERDAAAALLADEDLDWSGPSIRREARTQFPADFESRMRTATRAR